MLTNSVWGLIALVAIAAIVFVRAGNRPGESGGDQAATILKASGGAGSSFIAALEGGSPS